MSFVIFRDQKSFMHYFDQHPGPVTEGLYKALIDEEVGELNEAWAAYNVVPTVENATEVADACIDTLYVVIGLMHAMGLDPQPLWDEVHRSNVDKIKHLCTACAGAQFVNVEGTDTPCPACKGQGHRYEVRRREDGKVLKPEGWQPPQLRPLIEAMLPNS